MDETANPATTETVPSQTTSEGGGVLAQSAADMEQKFPGVDTTFPAMGTDPATNVSQRDIFKLDVLRLAAQMNEAPDATAARATTYLDWIDGQ